MGMCQWVWKKSPQKSIQRQSLALAMFNPRILPWTGFRLQCHQQILLVLKLSLRSKKRRPYLETTSVRPSVSIYVSDGRSTQKAEASTCESVECKLNTTLRPVDKLIEIQQRIFLLLFFFSSSFWSPNQLLLSTKLHGVTSQKTVVMTHNAATS